MSEKSAVNFWEYNLIGDDGLNPIFFVFEWEVQNESPTLSKVFLKLVVYQIQNILFIDRFTHRKVFNNAFLNGIQSANYITIFVSFWRIFLEKFESFEDFLDNCLNTDVYDIVFFRYGFG